MTIGMSGADDRSGLQYSRPVHLEVNELSKEPEEKRMAGDYKIIQFIRIGDREIVMGENQKADNGKQYMVSYCRTNELFRSYYEAVCSDDYAEIVGEFGKRIAEMSEKVRNEIDKIEVDITPITAEDCFPLNYKDDINNKVIAINADVMRPEYKRADRQLCLVVGGFGASSNSRGSAVFCTNLYTGKTTRWERSDVLGVVKPECLPVWAKQRETEVRANKGIPKEKGDSEVR